MHDFSSEGVPIYLIMELITGGTLRELLAERGPMPAHHGGSRMRIGDLILGNAYQRDDHILDRAIPSCGPQ